MDCLDVWNTWPSVSDFHYSDVIMSDGVSNYRRLECFINRLFRRRSKKTSNLRVTGLFEGNSPVTKEFPAQRASNAENVSIWWRHHVFHLLYFLQLNCCEEYLPVSWFVAVVLSVEFSLIQQGHFTSSVTMARFPLPVKQPWRIWLNKSNESIRIWWYNHNAATNQSTTKLCVDLSGSPIDFQWGNQRYIKSNLDRYMRLGDTVSPNYNRIGLSLYTQTSRVSFSERQYVTSFARHCLHQCYAKHIQ